jgi:hypothetical protein
MNRIKSIVVNVIGSLCLLIGACNISYSQKVYEDERTTGFGAAIIYNFHAEGWGVDLRAKIPLPPQRLFIVPEISYFPSFNLYHDLYGGAAFHYEIFAVKGFTFYALAGGYYHKWINAEDFAPGLKKEDNFAPEAGAGFIRSRGCIRPFIENRYDFKWEENNLRIGILIYPGSCNKKADCPAFFE